MGLNCLYLVSVSTGYFLPDMFGRRPILISTAAVCAVCLIVVAALTTAFPEPSEATQRASIALIFIWYAGFGVHSPLVWITTAEAAPTRNRERVIGAATFSGFGVSLLIAFVAPYIQNPDAGDLGSRIVSVERARPGTQRLSAAPGARFDGVCEQDLTRRDSFGAASPSSPSPLSISLSPR